MIGLFKIALSPLKGIAEIKDDLCGDNDEGCQLVSIMTFGVSSIIKGTLNGIKQGVDDIFD